MTVLDALSILEAAILECKQRDIYKPELNEALNFLQPRIRPEWLIPQFRYHAQLNDKNEVAVDKEAQQHALRRIFPRIRESVKDPSERNAAIHIEIGLICEGIGTKNEVIFPRSCHRFCLNVFALGRFVVGWELARKVA
jgi:hypothetical protein